MTFIPFVSYSDRWLENPTQSCAWDVQRLTKTGGDSNFSKKEKEPVSEEVQMLMISYDVLCWVIVQIVMMHILLFQFLLRFLYIYLLIFKYLNNYL